MAEATEYNARLGNAGLRSFYAEVTLVAGAGTVTTPLTSVKCVQITPKEATPTLNTYGATSSGGTVTVSDDAGSSTDTLFVHIIGY